MIAPTEQVDQAAAAIGCVACNHKGLVHVAGYVPAWVPRVGPTGDDAPCPWCRREEWDRARDAWEKDHNTGPAAHCGGDRA